MKLETQKEHRISVALVCVSMNQLGGKNVHMRDLYLNLDSTRFNVYLICTSAVESALRRTLIADGIPEENLIFLSRFLKWTVLPYMLALARIFKEKKIDIVHTFQLESDVLGAPAACLANVRALFSIMESKVIPEHISRMKKTFYRIVNKFIKNWFRATIAVSSSLAYEIAREFRPAESVRTIPVGITVPSAYQTKEWSVARLVEGKPVIGTIGRLSKEKGLDRFIDAMPSVIRRIPRASFVIVGSGPEDQSLRRLAESNGLNSKITFKPWTENVWQELEALDIFVMPSLREGCPHSLLEAMWLERPVVVSHVEGLLDIVTDGVNGLTADTSDPEAFATQIQILCEAPAKAQQLGAAGKGTVQKRFLIDAEVKDWEKLYLEAVHITSQPAQLFSLIDQ